MVPLIVFRRVLGKGYTVREAAGFAGLSLALILLGWLVLTWVDLLPERKKEVDIT